MNRKDDYLRFEYGNIINFSKNQEELNSSDFRTANDKKLFNIFSGGKDVLGKKEYKSYILIDFNKATKKTMESFEDLNNLDVFFQTIMLEYNTRLFERE